MWDFSIVGYIASVANVPEPALRLILSIFITYPMAIYYNRALTERSRNYKNIYFFTCGLSIGLFNFGFGILHSLHTVLLLYVCIKLLGPTKYLVIFTFLYNMCYLLAGYYYTASESYDIIWTMPHCVLTLRLIGLSFDLLDGTKPEEKLSATTRQTNLRSAPTLLELAAFAYFPSSFLIGPQFSMRKYLGFLDMKQPDNKDKEWKPTKMEAALKRMALGIVYLAAYQIGYAYFSNEYLLSADFKNASLFRKHIILGLWGKVALYKYIACWLLSEGSGILFGAAYNGTKDGITQWDGFSNVKILVFEGATKFTHYIDSFNVNTNHWVATYIYKRLIFLGDKTLSQAGTLIFLAIWHGFHSGYYMTFLMEFIIVLVEKDFEDMLKKSPQLQSIIYNKYLSPFIYILQKFYTFAFMGFCFSPFTLLHFSKWWEVYSSVYFSGFILFFPWMFVYKPLLKKLLKFYQ